MTPTEEKAMWQNPTTAAEAAEARLVSLQADLLDPTISDGAVYNILATIGLIGLEAGETRDAYYALMIERCDRAIGGGE